MTNAPRGFVVFLPVTRTIRSLCLRSLLVIVRIMCQGNYDLDSDDDCVIDIPFNGDLMISQQHNLQEEDEGLFGIPFNEDWQNWRQHRGFLLNRISQRRPGDSGRNGDYLEELLPKKDDVDVVEEKVMEDGNQLAGLNPKAVAEIMEKKDLKRLQELGGAEKVASILGSDVGVGKVAEGQQSANLDTTITVYEIHHFILKACRKTDKILLFFQAVFTLAYGMVVGGLKTGWHIGVAILVIWFIRVAYPSVSSFFGVRKMEKRLNERNRVKVEVVRSGKSQIIRLCDIVEGDIVRLSEGNLIPADGLLVSGNRMVVDGALHKEISCNGNPFLYYGSKVVEGHGRMLVTSVGTNMELSKLMSSVTNYQDKELLFKARLKKPSPYADIDDQNKEALLEDRIGKPLGWLGNFALLMPIFCVVVKFILFFFWKNNKSNVVQTLKGAIGVEWAIKLLKQILDKGGKMNLLATIISTLVFGLQHGVKIVISICLNYWNVIRGSSEVTPQNLSAPGTMGIVTVICIDASGGLLYEKMDVSRFWMWQEAIDDQSHYEVSPAVLEALSSGVGASALVPEIHSIPTDDVLISWAELEWGMNIEFLKQRLTILKYGKLSSTKEGRGVVLRKNGSDENIMHLHWNGDAKTILDMCSHYYKCRGEIHGIKDQKSEIEKVIKEMQDDGLQPIAFAYKQTDVEQLEEDGLILLALVGVKYQFQEEMKSVVKNFQSAGIRIILVSENELSTSRAMACELGIFTPGSINGILEGQEFRELTYDARKEKIEQVTLMGSSLPEDKLLMVKSLKEKGDVVAYIGGWTGRDAPVLKEADIGITVGTWSTEMTNEISDIVLASDKSFSSLIPVLEYGRHDYHKIGKFIEIQLISNISVLLITAVETICLGDSSITIVQFLYVNLILGLLGGLLLGMKPQCKELRNSQPGKRNASIITKEMWINISLQVSYQAIVLLVFQFKGTAIHGTNPMDRKAMVFNGFILCQVFNYVHPLFKAGKYPFWLFLVPFTVLHVVVVTKLWGELSRMQWAFCFLIAALAWGVNLAAVLISILIKWKFGSAVLPNGFSRLIPLAQSLEPSSSTPSLPTSHCPAFLLKFQCC